MVQTLSLARSALGARPPLPAAGQRRGGEGQGGAAKPWAARLWAQSGTPAPSLVPETHPRALMHPRWALASGHQAWLDPPAQPRWGVRPSRQEWQGPSTSRLPHGPGGLGAAHLPPASPRSHHTPGQAQSPLQPWDQALNPSAPKPRTLTPGCIQAPHTSLLGPSCGAIGAPTPHTSGLLTNRKPDLGPPGSPRPDTRAHLHTHTWAHRDQNLPPPTLPHTDQNDPTNTRQPHTPPPRGRAHSLCMAATDLPETPRTHSHRPHWALFTSHLMLKNSFTAPDWLLHLGFN